MYQRGHCRLLTCLSCAGEHAGGVQGGDQRPAGVGPAGRYTVKHPHPPPLPFFPFYSYATFWSVLQEVKGGWGKARASGGTTGAHRQSQVSAAVCAAQARSTRCRTMRRPAARQYRIWKPWTARTPRAWPRCCSGPPSSARWAPRRPTSAARAPTWSSRSLCAGRAPLTASSSTVLFPFLCTQDKHGCCCLPCIMSSDMLHCVILSACGHL